MKKKSEFNYVFKVDEIKESNYVKKEKKKIRDRIFNSTTVLWIILIASIFLNIYQYFYIHEFDKFVKILFINKDNEFQWGGVTALVAIVSLTITAITTLRKNHAELVSKSRIEWLQKVKRIMAEYLRDLHYYPYLYSQHIDPYSGVDNLSLKKELTDLSKKIEENQYLLFMNLSDNLDNRQLNDCIENCANWINKMEDQRAANSYTFVYETTVVTNLLKVSRDYFKREWDKAKRGK